MRMHDQLKRDKNKAKKETTHHRKRTHEEIEGDIVRSCLGNRAAISDNLIYLRNHPKVRIDHHFE